MGGAREVASRTNVQIVLIFSLYHFDHFFCIVIVWREGNPFQGPRVVSCLRLRNELSKETHVLTKQEAFIGTRNPGGEQQDKGTQENCFVALPFYDDGVSFWVVSGQ